MVLSCVKPALNASAETATEISPPGQYRYGALEFSPDCQYLYFRRAEETSPTTALYRMLLPDGSFTKLSVEAHSAVTISPDGKRMAFIRYYPETRESALIIAQTDGAGERTLSVRRPPESFFRAPAWSPDDPQLLRLHLPRPKLQLMPAKNE